jgi:hypothetical protein
MQTNKFKVGDRVRCIEDGGASPAHNKSNPPVGTLGTINGFDEAGDIRVTWDITGPWYSWVYADGHEIELVPEPKLKFYTYEEVFGPNADNEEFKRAFNEEMKRIKKLHEAKTKNK